MEWYDFKVLLWKVFFVFFLSGRGGVCVWGWHAKSREEKRIGNLKRTRTIFEFLRNRLCSPGYTFAVRILMRDDQNE